MIVPMLVTRFLGRAVKLYPNKTAVVCGERRFTYAEYGTRVNRLSNALLDIGVKKGDRVSFLSFNCHRLLEAYYGVVQIGAVIVPLNARLSAEELAWIVNHAEASVLFVDRDLLTLIGPVLGRLETVREFVLMGDGDSPETCDWMDYETLLASASVASPPQPPMDENDLAEIFYTSGTTGKPKGVMLTHRNLYLNAFSFVYGLELRDGDVFLQVVPLFHVNGWGTPHFLTCVGGTNVLVRAFDPQKVFELIERERVTISAMVPTMLNALLNFPDAEEYDVTSFSRLLVGGSPPPASFLRAAAERFGVDCFSGYGTTETSPGLAMAKVKSHLGGLPQDEIFRIKARTGFDVIGVELRVVDEDGADVKNDGKSIGEIVARGNNVMQGYWKDPVETARVIVDGWFHTGDLATVDEENYMLIVDRKKDIIISGGENIASVEIEDVLYSHPAVLENAVIAVPDPKWGEVPKAIVVLKPGRQATEPELIDYCRTRLAKFKLPKSIEFIDSLPKTGTGKVLKGTLRDRYWAGREKRVN
ncbi:MAG: fatty acid--CoA ligase [Chloroflexi bacterium]|nr:fatty acid--CoA ligase [Chloroflexota bacterium]